MNFPKLRRGGELVELKLSVPAGRVTMVTRQDSTTLDSRRR